MLKIESYFLPQKQKVISFLQPLFLDISMNNATNLPSSSEILRINSNLLTSLYLLTSF